MTGDEKMTAKERTATDYAIEHAGYLAKAAEAYLAERNKFDELESQSYSGDSDALSDHFRALQSAIYEFRKRAQRAAAAEGVPVQPPELSDIRDEPKDLESRVEFWRTRSDKLAAMYGKLKREPGVLVQPSNDQELAAAVHINYCEDLVEDGTPWEIPAEPEPLYFETFKEALVYLVNWPEPAGVPIQPSPTQMKRILEVLRAFARDNPSWEHLHGGTQDPYGVHALLEELAALAEAGSQTDLWLEFTVTNLCSLCGQKGVIDTRGIRTPANVECGGLHYCICPNGRALKSKNVDKVEWLRLSSGVPLHLTIQKLEQAAAKFPPDEMRPNMAGVPLPGDGVTYLTCGYCGRETVYNATEVRKIAEQSEAGVPLQKAPMSQEELDHFRKVAATLPKIEHPQMFPQSAFALFDDLVRLMYDEPDGWRVQTELADETKAIISVNNRMRGEQARVQIRGIALQLLAHFLKPSIPVPLQKADRWVSIDERLPGKVELYLGFVPPNIMGVCFFADGEWNWPDNENDREAFGLTHWMELPNPPGGGALAEARKDQVGDVTEGISKNGQDGNVAEARKEKENT